MKNTTTHEGKCYAMDRYGDILIWRLASRCTGRWHWVRFVGKIPAIVVTTLREQEKTIERSPLEKRLAS